MKNHQITAEQLIKYRNDVKVVIVESPGKRIKVDAHGNFHVSVDNKPDFVANQPWPASEYYNKF